MIDSPGLKTPVEAELQKVERPENAAEVASILRSASEHGHAVVPIGGGGALTIGNLTSAGAIGLSTVLLGRVIDYQPTDMTLSVEAGARLADVAAVLAEHGQMIPIEAPNADRATIGGLIATALSGPRRYGGGTLRDVIIGIQVAYPDGTIGKAGGLVVKNVSGFDMMRIHYGAIGTLGVITAANFKVLARPRVEFSISHRVQSLGEATPIVTALRPLATRPVALVVSRAGTDWDITARFEGRESGLTAVATRLADIVGTLDKRDDADSVAWWRTFMDGRAFDLPAELRLRIGTTPAQTIARAEELLAWIDQFGKQPTRFEIEPGLGQLTVSWNGFADDDSLAIVQGARSLFTGDTVTVLAAPDAIKRSIDVWGEESGAIDIMRKLKQEYDPGGTLNPGRFSGLI